MVALFSPLCNKNNKSRVLSSFRLTTRKGIRFYDDLANFYKFSFDKCAWCIARNFCFGLS